MPARPFGVERADFERSVIGCGPDGELIDIASGCQRLVKLPYVVAHQCDIVAGRPAGLR
jgi:hypothetical protein